MNIFIKLRESYGIEHKLKWGGENGHRELSVALYWGREVYLIYYYLFPPLLIITHLCVCVCVCKRIYMYI